MPTDPHPLFRVRRRQPPSLTEAMAEPAPDAADTTDPHLTEKVPLPTPREQRKQEREERKEGRTRAPGEGWRSVVVAGLGMLCVVAPEVTGYPLSPYSLAAVAGLAGIAVAGKDAKELAARLESIIRALRGS